MATGYTYDIAEGNTTKLKDYLLDCARNFGFNLNPEIEYRIVDDYHLRSFREANAKFEQISKITDEELQKIIDEEYKLKIKEEELYFNDVKKYKQRYLNMLEKVKAWNPPTKEHMFLKNFAIKQLEISIKSDCGHEKTKIITVNKKDNIDEYRIKKIDSLLEDMKYHLLGYIDEIKYTRDKNKWINDFINSLK